MDGVQEILLKINISPVSKPGVLALLNALSNPPQPNV